MEGITDRSPKAAPAPVQLDRASWHRIGAHDKDACQFDAACRERATVKITISAILQDGSRGGEQLNRMSYSFCEAHAQQRYVGALGKLNGQGVVRA